VDSELTPEQEELRDGVRRLLAELAPIERTRALWEAPEPLDRRVWAELGELGWLGLLAPEKHGGAGAGMLEAGLVLEEIGRVVFPGPFLSSAVGALSAAVALDAGPLIDSLARGERIGTLALIEPARSLRDWRAPGCSVSGERVSGHKVEVMDAALADVFLVSTRDGVFEVAADAPGVALEPQDGVDGSRRLANLVLEAAAARRLGALEALAPAIDHVLLGLACEALGAAAVAKDLAVEYAKTRQQFGQPIGAFQAVAHLCTDMLQAVELGRGGIYHALWSADAAAPIERHRTAVMAKAYASEYLARVAADAIQVHGGIGFAWETDVQLYFKRLLGIQATWGSASVWYEELAGLVT
jgi:acyl-CoA dehydrogenase